MYVRIDLVKGVLEAQPRHQAQAPYEVIYTAQSISILNVWNKQNTFR